MSPRRLFPETLHNYVEVGAADCWLWTRSIDTHGYGRVSDPINGGHRYAHRVIFEMLVGPIPEGLQIDHLCRVRRCVNPDHLEPVTASENSRRSPIKGLAWKATALATHCVNGHERTPDNLYVPPGRKHGGRGDCRTCRAEAFQRWQRRYA